MKTKQCIKCNKKQKIDHFHSQKASKDGKSPYCKLCHKAYNQIRRQKNKKKIKEQQKTYRKKNKNHLNEYRKLWEKNNPDKISINAKNIEKNTEIKLIKNADLKEKRIFNLD